VLPIGLLVGLGTYLRLVEADMEDVWLVVGMNRIRHVYLELAPDLDPYFVTSHHDDEVGVLKTYSFRHDVGVSHLLSGFPVIVGIIDAVISGVLAAIASQALALWSESRKESGSWWHSPWERCSVLLATGGSLNSAVTIALDSRS
jgi:hypothetical protein